MNGIDSSPAEGGSFYTAFSSRPRATAEKRVHAVFLVLGGCVRVAGLALLLGKHRDGLRTTWTMRKEHNVSLARSIPRCRASSQSQQGAGRTRSGLSTACMALEPAKSEPMAAEKSAKYCLTVTCAMLEERATRIGG